MVSSFVIFIDVSPVSPLRTHKIDLNQAADCSAKRIGAEQRARLQAAVSAKNSGDKTFVPSGIPVVFSQHTDGKIIAMRAEGGGGGQSAGGIHLYA